MMSAKLTDEERELLFPVTRMDEWEMSAFKLTRFLRHNRRLILSHERHIIQDLAAEWKTEADKVYSDDPITTEDLVDVIAQQWLSAHWPLGYSPVQAALESAMLYPTIPPVIGDAQTGGTHYLVQRVAYHLNTEALRNGETSFYISSHFLGKLIGANHRTVLRALKRLERLGFLVVAKRGNAEERRATHYLARFTERTETP